MNILDQIQINIEEYNRKKSNDNIPFLCSQCKNIKNKKKRLIQFSIKENKNQIFCSNSCSTLHRYSYLGDLPSKEKLEIFIAEGMSSNDIAKKLGRSQTSIRHWLKKYELKTQYDYSKNRWEKGLLAMFKKQNIENPENRKNYIKHNWEEIQKFYDSGKTWEEIGKEFNISMAGISLAQKNGLFISRKPEETWKMKHPDGKGRPQSEETKQKLSKIRKKYLKDNNLNRWHNKSEHHKSWLCETVKSELSKKNILFIEEYQPLLHIDRFFSIDISFPDKKLGFEINGRQHYDDKGNLLPYYQNRHDLITNDGWILHELSYTKDVSRLVDFIINEMVGRERLELS